MAGINGSMAHLSDGLFTTAIATYALAMVGHTAEFTRLTEQLRGALERSTDTDTDRLQGAAR